MRNLISDYKCKLNRMILQNIKQYLGFSSSFPFNIILNKQEHNSEQPLDFFCVKVKVDVVEAWPCGKSRHRAHLAIEINA